MKKKIKYLIILSFMILGFGISNVNASECTTKYDVISCKRYDIMAEGNSHIYLEVGLYQPGNESKGVPYIGVAGKADYSDIKTSNAKDSNGNLFYQQSGVLSFAYKIDKKYFGDFGLDGGTPVDVASGTFSVNSSLTTYWITPGGNGTMTENSNSGGGSIFNGDPGNTDAKLPIDDIDLGSDEKILQAFQIVGYLLFAVKIVVPLILIIMGIMDFAKAVISSDDKANKTALNSLIIRIIAGVVIFLIPTVLNFAISIIDGATETASNFAQCTNCLFDPFNCNGTENEE